MPSAVEKALQLLEVFIDGPEWLGVTEVARRSGLAKSTAYRLLVTLERHGFVEREGARYALGERLFELGCQTTVARPMSLSDVARPHLGELFLATAATVHLAVLGDTEVLYLDKLCGRRTVPSPTHVGARLPAAVTGLGMALLAFGDGRDANVVVTRGLPARTRYSITAPGAFFEELERTQARGYAIDRERARLGVNCIAAPVVVDGGPVAAVSICLPATTELIAGKASAVKATAAAIAADVKRAPARAA